MQRPQVQNTALLATLLDHVRQHDKLQDKGVVIFKRTHVQDFAGASYTLTVSRDATGDALTCIHLTSTWPKSLQVDNLVIARLLQRNSPPSLSIVGSDDSISVSWLLSSGLYLVEPYSHRTTEIVTWISKLRFWVLSARLQQSLSVWTHTPTAARPSEHFIHPRLHIITVPEADEFHAFFPVETTPEDAPVQQCLVAALTQHTPAPLVCSLAMSQDLPSGANLTAGTDWPILRLVLPRGFGGDAAVVTSFVEFIVFFPDLSHRWLIDTKMVVKRSMREFLETMRQSMEL